MSGAGQREALGDRGQVALGAPRLSGPVEDTDGTGKGDAVTVLEEGTQTQWALATPPKGHGMGKLRPEVTKALPTSPLVCG